MASISYENELNSIQFQACSNIEGPIMVIAGPGSGKTRVLTYRIAYMIDHQVAPYNILLLTFTNKAAREMKERLEKVVGPRGNHVWAGTFHSIFAKILRFEADKIGFPSSFTIYDTDDTKSMIGHIVNELNFDKKEYSANMIRNRISSAKSLLISPAAYKLNEELLTQDKMNRVPHLWRVYEMYAQRCKDAGVMDFDDLLYNTFVLFHRNPDNVLEKYRDKFKYIMVDEFQDTNFLQYAILKKLTKYTDSPENLCIVGDDAQSIYAFRGATIDNILDFEKDFPNLKTFKLEQNYRSTQHIVNAANNVITHNTRQIQKKIWTDEPDASKIKLIRALSDIEEGRKVVDGIFDVKNRHHIVNKEIAILYRTNAQSRVFEEQLRRANIPYKVFGGMSFYQRKEVKDMLAYFRFVVNPLDEEAFRRIINLPKRGIGDTSVEKLIAHAREKGKTIWDAMDDGVLPTRTQDVLMQFKRLISGLSKMATVENADIVARAIYKQSGMEALLKSDPSDEGRGRIENMDSLLDGIKEFVENDELLDDDNVDKKGIMLVDYLQNIALITDADSEEESNDYISLMSVHAAKGLEFDAVFVVGLEENLFPSFMSIQTGDPKDIDEERRLFYVAITRARKYLTVSYATSRIQFGKQAYNASSRFLEEVGEDNLNTPLHKPLNMVAENNTRASIQGNFSQRKPSITPQRAIEVVPSNPDSFVVGMQVLHPRFGKGVIKNIDGSTDNRVATIQFEDITDGDRRIMLRFAKMQAL